MKESSFFAREEAIRGMTAAICEILAENSPSIYLYGSCVLDDFRFGWSDIDLLVLTQERISPPQAQALVTLRQKLSEREMDNPYYRFFEGGMLTLQAFLSGTPDCVVYWGTSGQRITDTYLFDSFCMGGAAAKRRLVSGTELRGPWKMPAYCQFLRGCAKALCGDPAMRPDDRWQPLFLRMAAGYCQGNLYPSLRRGDLQNGGRPMGIGA